MNSLRLLPLLSGIVMSAAAHADVSVGDVAPHFTLSRINGDEFSTRTPRTGPLIVFFSVAGLGRTPWGWRDSLRTHRAEFEYVWVGDLGAIPWFLRPLVRRELRNENDIYSLLDWNGDVSEAWRGRDRTQLVVVVVAPDNRVRAIERGYATAGGVRAVIEATGARE